jgi:hypothetical protein
MKVGNIIQIIRKLHEGDFSVSAGSLNPRQANAPHRATSWPVPSIRRVEEYNIS